jgi:hypothetical protein
MRPTSRYIRKKIYRVYKSKKVLEKIKKYHLIGFKFVLIREKISKEEQTTLSKETLPKLIDYLISSDVYSKPDKKYVKKFSKKDLKKLETRPEGIDTLEQFKIAKKFKKKLMTRPTAKKLKLSHYFNGISCPKGHFSDRLTINGLCMECNRIRRKVKHSENREEENKKASEAAQKKRDINIKEFNLGKREKFWIYKIGKIKQSAKKRGIFFNLEIPELEKQWQIQKGKCFYSHIKLKAKRYAKKLDPELISVDRINPNIGYVAKNITFVSDAINTMKGDLTHKQFYDFAKNIVKNFNFKKNN